MSDFDAVKERTALLDLVLAESGGKLAGRSGQKDPKINPCPFCGHNDCFTVYPEERRYHCFSCGSDGDCFDFIQTAKSMDSVAALRYLAGRAGIDLPERIPAGVPGRSATEPDARHCIWARAVDYYQDALRANEAALEYQTLTRRHDVGLLREFGVGFADGNLGKSLAGEFPAESLLASGLVIQEPGRPPRDFFSWGFFVYPHKMSSRAGWTDVGDWTCKPLPGSENRKAGYRLRSEFRDEDCLFWNQPALHGRTVILVEGQNDLLSVAGKAGRRNVAALCGQISDAQLDFICRQAPGKTIYLCFDQDDAGSRYASRVIEKLSPLLRPERLRQMQPDRPVCDLRIVNWYASAKDIDDYLSALEAA